MPAESRSAKNVSKTTIRSRSSSARRHAARRGASSVTVDDGATWVSTSRNLAASALRLRAGDRLALLGQESVRSRLQEAHRLMQAEIDVAIVERQILAARE